ncbi:MAG TPA: ribosomal protein L7/L12 [Oculatellaceae cyanobacterium]
MPAEPLLAVAVATFILGFLLGRLVKSGNRSTNQSLPIRIDPATTPEQLEVRLKQLIGNRQKIEAIKELRTFSGLGLKQAKEIVDSLENGKSLQDVLEINQTSSDNKIRIDISQWDKRK